MARNPTPEEAAELEALRAKLEKAGKVKPVDHEKTTSEARGRTFPNR